MDKQLILSEIKRTASKMGGKAPGRLTFYKETGIREHDWSGKYWSRWSDAIKEAGLAPNKLTTGYDDDILIEKIVGLIEEIGHFPVSREIRIKAFSDRGFPSTKTFETHFGSKRGLVTKVIEYCQKKDGLEEVLKACEAVLPSASSDASPETTVEASSLGCVYLIKSGRFYKVGKTLNVGRRVYDVALQLAEKPTTIHVIKTDDPNGVEAYWHHRFKKKRMNGEWFNLNATDVKAFKRWLRIA